ncbi:MAG: redox-regulated ATPase YchF [Chloroflexi bacterium]|nr:redox-regulated ATPase YchF [Chloroflexota bacterium]
MDLAIVGLPLSGKTTLFQALAGPHAQRDGGRQADARREHVAVVRTPDERLEKLAALFQSKKVTPAEVRLHDLPAPLERGAALSGEAASSLGQADAIVHVVRAFQREDVPHPEGSVDPHRDVEALNLELAYHDLAIIERRLEKLDTVVRSARPGEREAGLREQQLLRRLKERLEQDEPLRGQVTDESEMRQLAGYGLLTLKPVLLLVNIDEGDGGRTAEVEAEFRSRHPGPQTEVVALCAKLEAELAELPEDETAAFRHELGVADNGAGRLLSAAYRLLDLVTFYTVVGDECRAWPVPKATTALAAAGRIHTDMERGFIRAEVIPWDRLLEQGSLAEAKKHGLLRTEGKQYAVQDGDVLHILFHV